MIRNSVRWLLLLGVVFAAVPAHAGREVVPLPSWSAFDGKQWGKLVLGEITRGEFEKRYSCRNTDLSGAVLKATTRNRTKSTVYVVFDGPGAEAHLAWVVAFYNGGESPSASEFLKQFGSQVKSGYLPHRRSNSVLHVAPDQGVAAMMEGDAGRAAMVLFSQPAQLQAIADQLSPQETKIEWALEPADFAPLEVRTGDEAVLDLAMERKLDYYVDGDYLERLLNRAAQDALHAADGLRLGAPKTGRTTVRVSMEVKDSGDAGIRTVITASARMTGDGPYGPINVSSDDQTFSWQWANAAPCSKEEGSEPTSGSELSLRRESRSESRSESTSGSEYRSRSESRSRSFRINLPFGAPVVFANAGRSDAATGGPGRDQIRDKACELVRAAVSQAAGAAYGSISSRHSQAWSHAWWEGRWTLIRLLAAPGS